MKSAEKQYLDAVQDELSGFKGRVMQRAKARIEEATRAYEEEERQKRLGPGGLDPVEVMETLPQELKECFESKSVAKLQEVLSNMPKEVATYHMKRCVDSGLWVPDAKAAGNDGEFIITPGVPLYMLSNGISKLIFLLGGGASII